MATNKLSYKNEDASVRSQAELSLNSTNKRRYKDNYDNNHIPAARLAPKRARTEPCAVVTGREIGRNVPPSRPEPPVTHVIHDSVHGGGSKSADMTPHKPITRRTVWDKANGPTKYTVYRPAKVSLPHTEFHTDAGRTYFRQPELSEDVSFILLTTETIHDVAIQSVEAPEPLPSAGVDQYKQLLAHATEEAPKIESKAKADDAKNTLGPTFRPLDEAFDFTKMPEHRALSEYHYAAFKGMTRNPLTALAIVRIAERNLPFVDFSSTLSYLPCVDHSMPHPQWRDDLESVAEAELDHDRSTVGSPIRVVFLPRYYADNRHAIGFYNRRPCTGRLGTMLFTPCTTDDLKDAKLLGRGFIPQTLGDAKPEDAS